jgi:hypothetical protein
MNALNLLGRIRTHSEQISKTGLLLAGISFLSATQALAGCGGFNYVKGATAIAKHDVASEITDIQFVTGSDPHFSVYFTVDAEDLGPFKVGGKFRIKLSKARIGPGKVANAAACFRFAPRKFNGPGPYKATFRLRGMDWGGVLPEATYKASLTVALHQGGRYFQDLNMDDNYSEMSTRYFSELLAQETTVNGVREDEEISLALQVVNAGNRPTGDLHYKWWTRGSVTHEDEAGFDAEEELSLEHTFERSPRQNLFGRKAKLIVKDKLGILRLRKVVKLKKGSGVTIEIDPDDEDPIEDDRLEGVDYKVSPVHASVWSLGDGQFVLSSSVNNEGKTDGEDITKARWSQLSIDGPFSFVPIVQCIPPLKANESREILAKLDLSGADDPSLRASRVSGILKVLPVDGEEDPKDNMVEFGLDLNAPEEEEPTPPEIVASDIRALLHHPKYAGYDGSLTLEVSLQNNGGDAQSVHWTLSINDLQPESSEDANGFEVEDIGSGSKLSKEFVTFLLPEDKWAAEDADGKRKYTGVIQGRSSYGKDGELEGPGFEFPFEFEVGKYPRPDLDVTVYVESSDGQRYVPAAQIFTDEESDLQVEIEVENNGEASIHSDDKVRVSFGIEDFMNQDFFEVAGMGIGDRASVHPLRLEVNCDYWKGQRQSFEVNASTAPTETRLANNEGSMDLKFDGSPDCN